MFDIAPIQHIPFWLLIVSLVGSIALSPLIVNILEKLIIFLGRIIIKKSIKEILYPIFGIIIFLTFFGIYSINYTSQTTYQKYFLDEYENNKVEIGTVITNYRSLKDKIVNSISNDIDYMDSLSYTAQLHISRIDTLEMKMHSILNKEPVLNENTSNSYFSNETIIDLLISLIIAGFFFLLGIIVQLERKYKSRNSIK